MRTVNVVSGNEGNIGAGLRLSGTQRSNKITGTHGWQKIEFDLEIGGTTGEVELVCELRATQGEASFDLDSLRLVRRD